jgi:hypothetical protein
MNLLSVLLLLALASLVIAISQEESSNLIPVNYYARIRNSGEGRNLADLGAIYRIPAPEVIYCDDSASFVMLFDVSVSPSYISLPLKFSRITYSIN